MLFQTAGDTKPDTVNTEGNQGTAEKEQTEELSNRTRKKYIRKSRLSYTEAQII